MDAMISVAFLLYIVCRCLPFPEGTYLWDLTRDAGINTDIAA